MILLLGCAARVAYGDGITGDVAPPDRPFAATAREWTRHLELYDALTTSLLADATLLSDAFCEQAEAQASHLYLAGTVTARCPADQTRHVFVVGATSAWPLDFGVLDYRKAPDWVVRAYAAGQECPLVSAEEIAEPSPLDVALFPWLTPYRAVWQLKFDATACGSKGPLELQFTGPHGTGEVGWLL
ncbi:MAG: hypothetical protein ACOZNI_00340 [Myxococcota bacterium]